MSDPQRTESVHPPEGDLPGERGAKIESLLLAGLDHYFAAEYDQAINIWTRVLFLDRGHTRARAYIDRARSALSEQQRESEELLQRGVAAFERGEAGTARRLLNSAVERGGAHDVALDFLARLNRLDRAAGPAVSSPREPARRSVDGRRAVRGRAKVGGRTIAAVLALAAAVVYVFLSRERIASWAWSLREIPSGQIAAPHRPEEPLPLFRTSETALARARALFASGRLHDALRAADLVRPTDPLRQDADRLRAEIQRELLAHVQAAGGPAEAAPVGQR